MYVHEKATYQEPGHPWQTARAIAVAMKYVEGSATGSEKRITVAETARIIGVDVAVWRAMRREGGRLNSRTIVSIINAAWANGYEIEVHMTHSGVRASARQRPVDVAL